MMPNLVHRRTLLKALIGGAAAWQLPKASLSFAEPALGIAQLDSNENPYGPSPGALKAAKQAVEKGAYYQWPLRSKLRESIANRQEISTDGVVLSSGSNEALCAIAAAWGKGGHIVAPELTYSSHLNYAKRTGYQVNSVPLKRDMSIDLDAMATKVNKHTSLVYVCNPNNPTGLTLDGDQLRDFCNKVSARTTVLIDEAYNELTVKPDYTSMMDLVRDGRNVIVTKTFSKIFGMAGMRVGYALARPDLAKKISAHVMSWPSAIGLSAALACYNDTDFIDYSKSKIVEGRKLVVSTFERHGINTLPSDTNFVYANINRNADQFAAHMKARGVIVRGVYAPYKNWLRVSMGRLEDLHRFSTVFDEVYSGKTL